MQKASQLGKPGFWRFLQKETKVNEDLNGANRLAENWRWKAGERRVFQSAFVKYGRLECVCFSTAFPNYE